MMNTLTEMKLGIQNIDQSIMFLKNELYALGREPKYLVVGEDGYKLIAGKAFELTGKLDSVHEYLGLKVIVVSSNIFEVVP